ncbi:MAG: Do family serine endopeptidase, partial [Gammaproteobacteria bacterium]
MKPALALFSHRPARRAALYAVPVLLGALALNGIGPAGALEAPAAAPRPTFERVQFADVIERVQPAVVKIDVVKTVAGVNRLGGQAMPFPQDSPFGEFMRRFGMVPFGPQGGQGGPPARAEGLGSGFIIDADGHVVTNNHVIDGADEMRVTLHDGTELPARLVGRDPLTDLALLKIEGGKDLPAVEFGDSDRARVGDWVVAIGNPFGFGGSATAGIISARGRDIKSGPYDDYLQIDAPINSGNSGGPIVDASGHVIGVNTAIYSPNGGNVGIGFAIPAAEAAQVITELKESGAVTRGWLGVQIQPVTVVVASALQLEAARGALVASVVDDSPASLAGVTAGDVIVRYGDTAIEDPRALSRAVAATAPGEKISLTVVRRGKEQRLVTVIDRNEQHALAATASDGNDAGAANDALGLGLALGELHEDARRRLELGDDVSGAFVVGVKNDGPAAQSGVRPGDVIVQVNQREVADVASARQALGEAKQAERPIVMLIRRSGEQFFTTM